MTYEDVNIKYAYELLKKYQFSGSFPHDDLRQEKHIKLTDEEKKLYTDNGLEWYPTLTGFMILKSFISAFTFGSMFSSLHCPPTLQLIKNSNPEKIISPCLIFCLVKSFLKINGT